MEDGSRGIAPMIIGSSLLRGLSGLPKILISVSESSVALSNALSLPSETFCYGTRSSFICTLIYSALR